MRLEEYIEYSKEQHESIHKKLDAQGKDVFEMRLKIARIEERQTQATKRWGLLATISTSAIVVFLTGWIKDFFIR